MFTLPAPSLGQQPQADALRPQTRRVWGGGALRHEFWECLICDQVAPGIPVSRIPSLRL